MSAPNTPTQAEQNRDVRDTGSKTRQYQQIVVDYTEPAPGQVIFISGVQYVWQAIILAIARVTSDNNPVLRVYYPGQPNTQGMVARVQHLPAQMILAGEDETLDPTGNYSKSIPPSSSIGQNASSGPSATNSPSASTTYTWVLTPTFKASPAWSIS